MSEKPKSNQNTSPEKIAELLHDPAFKTMLEGHTGEYISSGLMTYYGKSIKHNNKRFEDEPDFLKVFLAKHNDEEQLDKIKESHDEHHEVASESLRVEGPLLVTRHFQEPNDAGVAKTWYGLERYNPTDGNPLPLSHFFVCEVGDDGSVECGIDQPADFVPDAQLREFAEMLDRHFDQQVQAGLVIDVPVKFSIKGIV
ncbi:MAG TPA: hypothetical protein VMR34_00380 [Candidatus Saccharimonadales bacterium]|nr:hypothetical protein [Candidatus Saccharimonadales bacterium]